MINGWCDACQEPRPVGVNCENCARMSRIDESPVSYANLRAAGVPVELKVVCWDCKGDCDRRLGFCDDCVRRREDLVRYDLFCFHWEMLGICVANGYVRESQYWDNPCLDPVAIYRRGYQSGWDEATGRVERALLHEARRMEADGDDACSPDSESLHAASRRVRDVGDRLGAILTRKPGTLDEDDEYDEDEDDEFWCEMCGDEIEHEAATCEGCGYEPIVDDCGDEPLAF